MNNIKVQPFDAKKSAQQPNIQPPGYIDPQQQQPGNFKPQQQQPGYINPQQQYPGYINPQQQQPGYINPHVQQPGYMHPQQQQPGNFKPQQQQPGYINPHIQQPGYMQPQQQYPGYINPQQQYPGYILPEQQQPGYVNPDHKEPGFNSIQQQQNTSNIMQSSNTIIIGDVGSKPTKELIPKRDWQAGFCDCFTNIGGLCCAIFFPECYLYGLYTRADEGFCDCFFGQLAMLRTKVRTERGIRGSICEDVLCSINCPWCVMVQIENELRMTNSLFAKN